MDIDKNFIPRPEINKPSKLARAVGAPVGRCSGGQLKSTLVATTSDILPPPLRFECFQFEKIISNFPLTWLVIYMFIDSKTYAHSSVRHSLISTVG